MEQFVSTETSNEGNNIFCYSFRDKVLPETAAETKGAKVTPRIGSCAMLYFESIGDRRFLLKAMK